MKIHYKIIKKIPIDSQIVVRYFTDIATEEILAISRDDDGTITRTRADFLVNIPITSIESVETLIKQNCPYRQLEIEEKKILTAAGNTQKEIADNISKIEKIVVDSIKTLEFTAESEKTEEEIQIEKMKRVDYDADILIYSLYGARESMYKDSYVTAQKYKAEGYVGEIPQYIKNYMKVASISAIEATENIIKKAQESEKIMIDINTNRLIAKNGIRNNKEKSLSTWDKFVKKTKVKIG